MEGASWEDSPCLLSNNDEKNSLQLTPNKTRFHKPYWERLKGNCKKISVIKSVQNFAVQALGIGMCHIQKKTWAEKQLAGMTQVVTTVEF